MSATDPILLIISALLTPNIWQAVQWSITLNSDDPEETSLSDGLGGPVGIWLPTPARQ